MLATITPEQMTAIFATLIPILATNIVLVIKAFRSDIKAQTIATEAADAHGSVNDQLKEINEKLDAHLAWHNQPPIDPERV